MLLWQCYFANFATQILPLKFCQSNCTSSTHVKTYTRLVINGNFKVFLKIKFKVLLCNPQKKLSSEIQISEEVSDFAKKKNFQLQISFPCLQQNLNRYLWHFKMYIQCKDTTRLDHFITSNFYFSLQ